jgi:cytochrome c biogenesis protein CcmG/thiol:disulfide interchange protein DsbE
MISDAPSTAELTGRHAEATGRRRARLPLVLFFGLVLAFAMRLDRDPSRIPSALIGKPVPVFSLPPVKGRELGLSSNDLTGDVSLVNVFASWCVACREEHPLLMRLKADGAVAVHGLDYKDESDNAARWLNSMGDPYRRTGADRDGRVASPSTGASTAFRRPSSSPRVGRSRTNRSGRSRPRISKRRSYRWCTSCNGHDRTDQ